MKKFSQTFIETIKNVPIEEVARRYTVLKAEGQNQMKGLCPLHSEKTPSFHVHTDTHFFKCFGCGASGDTIQLVSRCDSLSFVEAVEKIATDFSIPIEYEDGQHTEPKNTLKSDLFKVHDEASSYYRELFLKTPEVVQYWTKDRAFKQETAEAFGIGFAPTHDVGLASRLLAKFGPNVVRESGLFYCGRGLIKSPEQLVPRFSGRLMIPIHDGQGRVCAFSGRQIPGIEDQTEVGKKAKYLNSPETPIFSKGKLLFNFHRARSALREFPKTRFVLVEGQLDTIRLWEMGCKLAVAPQGSSITVDQLRQLASLPNGVRILMDGDDAGLRAALRIVPMAVQSEADLVFDLMPAKHDPDSAFRGLSPDESALRFRAVTAHSKTPIALAAREYVPTAHGTTPQAKANGLKEVLQLLTLSPSPVAVWFAIEELTKLLKVDGQALWAEYARVQKLAPIPARP